MNRLPHGLLVAAFLLLGGIVLLPARADLTLGASARAVAMGGAGLATGEVQSADINPAFLADSGMRFGVQWPNIDTRVNGAASVGDAIDLLGRSKLSAGKALELIDALGSGPTTLDASVTAGVDLPLVDLRANAAVRTVITPNSAFSDWVNGGMTGPLPTDASADIAAAGLVTLPSVGFGTYVPGLPGRTAVGVRLKPTQAYYTRYTFDATNLDEDGRPKATLAPEMGGKEYLKATSVGADLGVMFTPDNAPNLHLAAVVNNLIEPKAISFRDGSPFGDELQVAPRTVSVGAAWVNELVTLAVDAVDITSNFDRAHLRVGAEMRGPLGLALRGGYNTKNGFTAGLGLGSFGVAFSKRTPVMFSHAVSF